MAKDQAPRLRRTEMERSDFEDSLNFTNESPIPVTKSADLAVFARSLVAVFLILSGGVLITTGVGLVFGLPWALVCAGILLFATGILVESR